MRSTERTVPFAVAGIPGGGRRAFCRQRPRDVRTDRASQPVAVFVVNKDNTHELEFPLSSVRDFDGLNAFFSSYRMEAQECLVGLDTFVSAFVVNNGEAQLQYISLSNVNSGK